MASPTRQAGASGDQPIAALDDLCLDRDAEVPLGVQLAWALKTRIAEGALSGGDRLPGLRELADILGVNANTVRSVYAKLEREGLLESRQGSGTFIAAGEGRRQKATRIAAKAAREAVAAEVDPRDVASILYVQTPAPGPVRGAGTQADRRSALRAQITTLEQALGELEAEHPTLARRARRQHPGASARRHAGLPSTTELEEVKSSLLRRLSAIQAEIDALGQSPPAEAARGGGRRARRSAAAAADKPTAPGKRTAPAKPAARAKSAPARPARAARSPRASGGGSRPAPAGA
jgi:DNA-binding transcriptional regulator YhcF (GntR family)